MFSRIRVRLTLWYLLVFGSLLIIFSLYIYSVVSRDMHNRFDASLLRTSQSMANYFSEFRDRQSDADEANETISQLKEGRESAAIFREGQLLATNNADVVAAISSTRILETSEPERKPAFATEPNLNKRLVVFPFQYKSVNYMSAVFEPLDKLEAQIGNVRKLFLFGLSAALLLGAVGGFLLAQKSLAPMVNISEQAAHISARNLSERLKITSADDELGRLAGVFNELLSRLDTSFSVMREFMADASHELRTPLTIIHGEAQVSLSRSHSESEYRQSLGIIRDQAKRMANIVSDMLALARADAGEQHLSMEDLYLNDLVTESCKAAQALAGPKHIQLSCEAPEDLVFHGNEELLQRMIVNLVDNAIRYTPAGGSVTVKLTSNSSCSQLVVSDTGIGISPECVGRVFYRFYRLRDVRTPANGGRALALSIVKPPAESTRRSSPPLTH